MGRISFKTSVEAIFGFFWSLVRVVLLSVVLNPLIWWIWALVAPKSAVGLLAATSRDEKYKLIRFCGCFWFVFAALLIHVLPWRSKRCFFRTFTKMKMSDRQQARAYCEGWFNKDQLSDVAKDIVWYRPDGIRYWKYFAKERLSFKKFCDMLTKNAYEVLEMHLAAQMPSEEKMQMLLSSTAKVDDSSLIEIIKNTISKYGLYPKLIKRVFDDSNYEGIRSCVMSSLELYNEVATVKSLSNDMNRWTKFLSLPQARSLSVSSQRVFTEDQFKRYRTQAYDLDQDLLWEWMIDAQKRNWVVDYVKHLINHYVASDAVKALVKHDPWWREQLMFF